MVFHEHCPRGRLQPHYLKQKAPLNPPTSSNYYTSYNNVAHTQPALTAIFNVLGTESRTTTTTTTTPCIPHIIIIIILLEKSASPLMLLVHRSKVRQKRLWPQSSPRQRVQLMTRILRPIDHIKAWGLQKPTAGLHGNPHEKLKAFSEAAILSFIS